MKLYSKTKLIATYGPSLEKCLFLKKYETISEKSIQSYKELKEIGVDVFRLNFSHNTLEEQKQVFNNLRKLSKKSNIPIGILIDTKGPEIRVGKIQIKNINDNIINKNDIVKIFTNKPNLEGNKNKFNVCDYSGKYNLCLDVSKDDHILIDDGKLVLKVIDNNIDQNEIITKSLIDKYEIKTNKRINLTNKKYSLPFLSDYDILTIKNAVKWDADFIAFSFISNINEVNQIKKIISDINPNSKLKLICKIESYEATQNLEELIENTDGAMVARGDLSLEIGYEKVPIVQDEIIRLCNKHNKISIVATQMLDSTETRLLPTRAEVTDCYYAVKSLADSTMLSSESASGIHPINSIKIMKNITNYAEQYLSNQNSINFETSFYLSKKDKKIIKKIEKLSLDTNNIILKNFSDHEIKIITSSLLNKKFFILTEDYENISKFSLYKNLEIAQNLEINDYTIIDNK